MDAKTIWEAALGELQLQVSKPNYETWLQDTVAISYQDDVFVIGTPNVFKSEWLRTKIFSLIRRTLVGIIGKDVEVKFEVLSPAEPISRGKQTSPRTIKQIVLPGFNEKNTFERFVVGRGNEFAFKAAQKVVVNPGTWRNPVSVYGRSGTGKTFLLHAMANAAKSFGLSVVYTNAEALTRAFVLAIKTNETEELLNIFYSASFVLLDDVQFLQGKVQTQEFLVCIFNRLREANQQMVFASDSPLSTLKLLPVRLTSRLKWGVNVIIQPLDFETHLAILQNKAAGLEVEVPPEVLQLICKHPISNIRELEERLNRVLDYSELVAESVPTLEIAEAALNDGFNEQSGNHNAQQIIERVALHYDLIPADLKGPKRDKACVTARQLAMYLLRTKNNFTLQQIGNEFGGRDHATVDHACKKVSGTPELLQELETITI